jgi:prophage maintenance system killer protein
MLGDSPEQDLEFLTEIHDRIIDASGGSKGFHDVNLVKSALARPLHSAFGDDAYGGIYEKAAALLDSLANNHGCSRILLRTVRNPSNYDQCRV